MSESTATWRRAEEIFHEALAIDADQRAAFVERATQDDAELRELVGELLAGHGEVDGHFLESPGAPPLEGRRIGEFTLVKLLASGGMGAVYEAVQDRPRRSVAIKVIRALPGVASDARRIEIEAELMGRLSHPNIAQILAAGVLDDPGGRLAWFAMELVDGARDLVEYARAENVRGERLFELFELVCGAVAHGHQRGVVHCDLKPANVLVDASGAPKVIDFGIARALGADATSMTLAVQPGEIAGTLAYMAPERADGAAAVDTRADVYALGVILYELTVGRRPIELAKKTLTQALEAVRREEPARPRSIDPAIDPDLETILLTALDKDPERRYGTVHELADDLLRFRRREPIRARPVTRWHRAALFFRRNRVIATAIAIAALALVGATVVSSISALRATRARDSEAHARADAERVTRLHQRMFTAARPGVALGREVTVREILDDALFDAERELAGDPRSLVEILETIGSTYSDIGRLQEAERVLGRALALARDNSSPARVRQIESLLGYVMLVRGRYVEADQLLRAAIEQTGDAPEDRRLRAWSLYRRAELLRSTHRERDADQALVDALALCTDDVDPSGDLRARILGVQGNVAYQAGDFARAEQLHRAALAIDEKTLPADHPLLAGARNGLAGDLFDQNRVDEARDLWEQALATFERVLDPDHPDIATVVGNLALVYQRRREFQLAEPMFKRALEMRKKALGPDHPRVAKLLGNYSGMLLAKGDLERAEEVATEAVDTRRRGLEHEHASLDDPGVAGDLFSLAVVQRQRHRLDEAEINLRTALRIQRATLEPQHVNTAQTLTLLGAVLIDRGMAGDSEPLVREAWEIRKLRMPDNWLTANTESVLGGCLLELGRTAEAEPLLAASLPAIERTLGADDYRTRDARERLARLYEQTGRSADAEQLRAAKR